MKIEEPGDDEGSEDAFENERQSRNRPNIQNGKP